MKILSSVNEDVRHKKPDPGGYEWWYFDAIDSSGIFRLVIIFYDGIPFSLDYIDACKNAKGGKPVLAENHPGISISVYENDKPVFYDLSEYPPEKCSFSYEETSVVIGNNKLHTLSDQDIETYILEIDEELPDGDHLKGTITFSGKTIPGELVPDISNLLNDQHVWNLVSPKTRVSAELELQTRIDDNKEILFTGNGYHDHNYGHIPMYDTFRDWYWARFHFEKYCLVIYAMNDEQACHQAWLIDDETGNIAFTFTDFIYEDYAVNAFLLGTNRRILISGKENDDPEIQIFLGKKLDSGPYYIRFAADAILHLPDLNKVEKSGGMAEYIYPSRMKWKIFWPLIRMRLQVPYRRPHPVQKSPRLYRWTW